MAWVRGQDQLVYQRVYRQLRDRMLVDLGWDGQALGRMPWGAERPLQIHDMPFDPKLEALEPNYIAMSEGLLPDDEERQMGGGLEETSHTVFIDILAESIPIAKRIASDVRSILVGKAPGCSRYLSLLDYTEPGEPVLPGHLIHLESIEVSFPDGIVKSSGGAHWAVVKATAVHEWNP